MRRRHSFLHRRSPKPDETSLLLGPEGQSPVAASPESGSQVGDAFPPQNHGPVSQVDMPGENSAISPISTGPTQAPTSLSQTPGSQPISLSSSPSLSSQVQSTASTPSSSSGSPLPSSSSSSLSLASATTSAESISSVSSSSSSVSTTTSGTTTAMSASSTSASAVSTVVAAPTPSSTPQTRIGTHSPPFYVGIVLGVIVAIAVIAALIAWYIRVRSHARRRRDFTATPVPWGNRPDDNDQDMEKAPDNIHSGGRTTYVTGESVGDRDVGEPKRSDSFLLSPTKRSPFNPFIDHPPEVHHTGTLADSLAFPLSSGPYPTTRPLPPHLASNTDCSVRTKVPTFGNLTVTNMMPGDFSSSGDEFSRPGTRLGSVNLSEEFGTPREPAHRPRFLGLGGEGLNVPWAPCPGPENTTVRPSGDSGNWEPLPSLPMPGESNHDTAPGSEGWKASWKGLANAFNAVARNLPSEGKESLEDNLTPVPRRVSQRLPQDQSWLAFKEGGSTRASTNRTTGSVASKAWTLEETAEGRGLVHIRGLDCVRDQDCLPGPSQTTLYLNDGSDSQSGVARIVTHESQTPLIIHKKPQPAVLAPRRTNFFGGALSRENSSYSTASISSSVYNYYGHSSKPPRLPALSRSSTMSTIVSKPRKSTRKKRTRPKIAPRTSSYESGASFGSDLSREPSERLTVKEEAAKRALKDRRKKLEGRGRGTVRLNV